MSYPLVSFPLKAIACQTTSWFYREEEQSFLITWALRSLNYCTTVGTQILANGLAGGEITEILYAELTNYYAINEGNFWENWWAKRGIMLMCRFFFLKEGIVEACLVTKVVMKG
jgi:hypothetical protein